METAHRRRDIARTNETNYANRIEQVQIELIYLRWDTLAGDILLNKSKYIQDQKLYV